MSDGAEGAIDEFWHHPADAGGPLTEELDAREAVRPVDAAGVDAIEVAHGDGLAGGSLNYGPGSKTDWEWVEAAAENLRRATLTALLLPGIGTIAELEHAYSLGVRAVRVATHYTEADASAQHIAATWPRRRARQAGRAHGVRRRSLRLRLAGRTGRDLVCHRGDVDVHQGRQGRHIRVVRVLRRHLGLDLRQLLGRDRRTTR